MRNLLFGLLLLFLSPLLRAQTPAVITFDQGQITVLRDKTKQLTLEQARSAHAEGQFRPLKGNLGLGFVPDAAWLHLSIDPDHPSARWLEVILFPAVEATETGGKLDCEPVSTVVE